MLELTGRIIGASISLDGTVKLELKINEEDVIRNSYDNYKDIDNLDIKIQRHREQKSKEANAYFHFLAHEIAGVLATPFAEIKNSLISRYGQPELLEDGNQLMYSSPAPVDFMMKQEAIHTAPVGYDDTTGQTLYAVYRGVHTYSKEEMGRLIDGTVSEAMQLGIDVYSSSRINEMKDRWRPGKT